MNLSKLKELNATANNNRGVTVIRDIIIVIERGGDPTSIAIHDNDKIRNYPDIQKELRNILPKYNAHLTKLENMFK